LDDALSLPLPPPPSHRIVLNRRVPPASDGGAAGPPQELSCGCGPDEAVRAEVVELLVGMLFADRTVSLAAAAAPSPEGFRFLTAEEIAEIVRRIEEVSLDGTEVDAW